MFNSHFTIQFLKAIIVFALLQSCKSDMTGLKNQKASANIINPVTLFFLNGLLADPDPYILSVNESALVNSNIYSQFVISQDEENLNFCKAYWPEDEKMIEYQILKKINSNRYLIEVISNTGGNSNFRDILEIEISYKRNDRFKNIKDKIVTTIRKKDNGVENSPSKIPFK